MLSSESIERGFARFVEMFRARAELWTEYQGSRSEFFAFPGGRDRAAERRHLEWFVLERPSQELSGVPMLMLQDGWRVSLAPEDAELSAALPQSLLGVFQVTSLVPEDGLWVRDLATRGEHPVMEAEASLEFVPGDLLVGRLYPVGSGLFRLSPAMACFRSPELVAAVLTDLERMRAGHRGVLRLQQLELERLFHSVPDPSEARPLAIPTALDQRPIRERLAELGLEPDAVAGLLEDLRRSARAGTPRAVTEILNRLAFETGVDLSAAQGALLEAWHAERSRLAPDREQGSRAEAGVRAALEAFDRGRGQGQDLEQLFAALERDLGLAGDDDQEDGEPGAPDFPGVVGAMIEEFLWEVERESGAEQAALWAGVRKLGHYGRDIGLFDELDVPQLLDFSGRWILDESGLADALEAERLLEALGAFCRWCEEHHELPLWSRFGTLLQELRNSVPRLVLLRRESAPRAKRSGIYSVLSVDDGRVLLIDGEGGQRSLEVTPEQQKHLRHGDVVLVARLAGREVLSAGYPKELASLLR